MRYETHNTPRPTRQRRSLLAVAGLVLVVAALVLSACGGSSSSGTSSDAANTGTTSGTTTHGAAGSNRFSTLQKCLEKYGVKLPSRKAGGNGPGTPPTGSGAPPTGGGGFKGFGEGNNSKFREAIKKCGGAAGFAGGKRAGFNSASAKAALTKYAACMKENGVDLPAPNTNGKGPVFDTKGVNTKSATFKKAQEACQSDLKGAFGGGRPPGGGEGGPPAGGEGAPGGAPPAGAEAQAG